MRAHSNGGAIHPSLLIVVVGDCLLHHESNRTVLSQSLLSCLLCLLVPLLSHVHSFRLEERSWRLSESLLYFTLCLLVPLSSPFLHYVQRKVLGACQNRLLVPLSSTFHSFLFEERSWRLSESLLYCLSSLSDGSALVYFSLLCSKEGSWRLSKSSAGSSLVSFSLIYVRRTFLAAISIFTVLYYLLSRFLFSPLLAIEHSLRLSQSAKIVLAD
jgi:hypothetical protein